MSLRGSYYWNTNYPKMRIDVSYSQTGRTGTSASYQVTMAVYFTSSGWHGYGLTANVNINGATQAIRVKEPSQRWEGAGHKGTWTFNVTASAGTGGGSLPASIALWGTEGDSTNINSGARSVSLSTWNTAPTWSGEGNVNGWGSAQIMPENTSTVTVNFPPASDREGNTIRYDVYRYVNGAVNAKVASGSTARSLTDNISAFGQGSKIKYSFACHDGSLWASGDKWTIEHTKNTFTPASINTSSRIGYETISIPLTISGAKNTNGNTSFTYRLSNTSGLTIYNSAVSPNSSGQVTFGIYSGSGARPSTPHIDLSDLKEYTAKGTYQGTLVLRLTTTNTYGSSDHRDVSIPIDLRTNPVPATIGNPTGAVAVAGSSYFIYNRSTITVSWSGAVDKLNVGALSYELFYKYGSGSWNRLFSTTRTSWTGALPQVTSATTCYFKVVATTSYGYSATSAEKSITMHYYNKPRVSYSSPNRTTTEFSTVITSATDTSISTVAISSRSYVGLNGQSVTFTGAGTTIKDTGLSGDSNYKLVVTVTDNSGLSGSTATLEVPVTAYIPIMSITDKGIAISSIADINYKLAVGGNVMVKNSEGGDIGITFDRGNNANWRVLNSGNTFKFQCDYTGSKVNYYDAITIAPSTGDLWVKGKVNASNIQVNGSNVYHTGRKPTAEDVGAITRINHSTYYGLAINGDENGWLRTPKSGLLPNKPNGTSTQSESSLGSVTWRFNRVYCADVDTRGIRIESDIKPTITLVSSTNPNSNTGGRLIFNSLDGQNCQIRHEWYDGELAPFGFIIEKAPGNVQGHNAGLKLEGHIEIGQYGSNGNMQTINHNHARLVRGNTDGAGSVKIQLGGSSAGSASFEVVNPQWDSAWFSCGVSGIRAKSYSNFSDVSLKTNISKVSRSISDRVKGINVYNYNYKTDFEDTMNLNVDSEPTVLASMPSTRWGVLAQEVEKVFPELIMESETLVDGENKAVKSVDVYGLTVITLEYAKELQLENERLKERLSLIEQKLGIV